ncbi:MAG TPA: hypothetical protein VFQ39_18330, partial [Longimicrobium sp.]|nr:hypothetical protein [Longimicrobium sp.]
LAVAALGMVAVSVFGGALDAKLEALGVSPTLRAEALAQRARMAAMTPPSTGDAALDAAVARAVAGSFVHAFRVVMLSAAALAVLAAAVARLTIADARVKQSAEQRE